MKKILIVMPKFFGYEKLIKDYLVKQQIIASIHYENLEGISFLWRFINIHFKGVFSKIYEKHINKILNKEKENFDLILIIRGANLTRLNMEVLKKKFPATKMIMYQWDSCSNNSNCLNISNYFNKIYTFDMIDAKNYNWIYRPLFYYKNDNIETIEKDIDLLFIGTLHSQRLDFYKTLKENAEKKQLKTLFRLYATPWSLIKHKYLKKNKLLQNNPDITSKRLSLNNLSELYSRTKVLADYTHPNQNGFSMRTIESIGYNCKLITNNKNIINADFYNPVNFQLYNDMNFNIDEKMINSDYQKTTDNSKYTFETWVNELIIQNL